MMCRIPKATTPTARWLMSECMSPLSLRGVSRLVPRLLAAEGSLVLLWLDFRWELLDRWSDDFVFCSLSFLSEYERARRPSWCRISGGTFDSELLLPPEDRGVGEPVAGRREEGIL